MWKNMTHFFFSRFVFLVYLVDPSFFPLLGKNVLFKLQHYKIIHYMVEEIALPTSFWNRSAFPLQAGLDTFPLFQLSQSRAFQLSFPCWGALPGAHVPLCQVWPSLQRAEPPPGCCEWLDYSSGAWQPCQGVSSAGSSEGSWSSSYLFRYM